MCIQLTFKFEDGISQEFPIHPEDIECARRIGVLTPRSVHPTDFVPAKVQEPRVPTWASRVSDASAQEKHDAKYLDAISDIEFLQFVDEFEEMYDTLGEEWERDLDGSVLDLSAPFGHRACFNELPVSSVSVEVRVISFKGRYYIGTIAGHPSMSVYINTRNIDFQGDLDIHSLYWMDLEFTPQLSMQWCATKVYPKLDTSAMKVSEVFIQDRTVSLDIDAVSDDWQDSVSVHTYRIPTPACLIGTMIGRQGRNIDNLIESVNTTSYGIPIVTIKPSYDGKESIVIVQENHCDDCFWNLTDIEWLVSNFHC